MADLFGGAAVTVHPDGSVTITDRHGAAVYRQSGGTITVSGTGVTVPYPTLPPSPPLTPREAEQLYAEATGVDWADPAARERVRTAVSMVKVIPPGQRGWAVYDSVTAIATTPVPGFDPTPNRARDGYDDPDDPDDVVPDVIVDTKGRP